MAQQTSVRYTVRDQATAEENQRLIDAVFAELAVKKPSGLSYRVSRSEDGLAFEHVALIDHGPNPLLELDSFHTFSSTIDQRVDQPPLVRTGEVIARYN